jgi:hypothetical protein
MKLFFRNRFLNVSNISNYLPPCDVLNISAAPGDDVPAMAADATAHSYRLVKYGIYPAVITKPDGSRQQIFQVIDGEAADAMISNFRTVGGGLGSMLRGIPIYEGHADDAAWRAAHPGHKPAAVGRIKAIRKEEDGIYVDSVFNSAGAALLSGEAPAYSAHSPRWRMQPIPGRANHYRPVLLWSDALTNDPNLPESFIALNDSSYMEGGDDDEETTPTPTENDMQLSPEALAALGLTETATAEEISAAILAMLAEKTTMAENASAMQQERDAANTRADAASLRLAEQTADRAIAEGRIEEAARQQWIDALNTSYETEAAKLTKLVPVLNTRSHLPAGLGERRPAPGQPGDIDAMNTAVASYAQEHGLDLGKREDHRKAWEGAKAANPEIFRPTAG